MGLVASRFNHLGGFNAGRTRRSQQEETSYSYSLNKNYFSNYFFMGGERFEVNDPDYLFGDNFDLNFLSCTKPHSFPYKQAQQNLISNLNAKHNKSSMRKSNSSTSSFSSTINADANGAPTSHLSRLSSPLNSLLAFSCRRNQASRGSSFNNKQQNDHSSGRRGKHSNGISAPSQPIIMLVNIRKETLRLVKSTTSYNIDSDLDSIQNKPTLPNEHRHPLGHDIHDGLSATNNRDVETANSNASSSSSNDNTNSDKNNMCKVTIGVTNNSNNNYDHAKKSQSEVSSLISATSSIKSGYTSIKYQANYSEDDGNSDDDDFKDALNDTTNISIKEPNKSPENHSRSQEIAIQLPGDPVCHIPLGCSQTNSSRDFDETDNSTRLSRFPLKDQANVISENPDYSNKSQLDRVSLELDKAKPPPEPLRNASDVTYKSGSRRPEVKRTDNDSNPTYNLQFYFDCEVPCSIRIFYLCTREVGPSGIIYKPQHATYKSKVYHYKKGLNQKFDQPDHTFEPYLFDEDLLIYKPLDTEGNYNTGAVFPIVIHCVALEGAATRQSQSLVATIEKSSLDESYSIKPLKQLIFVDNVQYILQDIYGIEHRQVMPSPSTSSLNYQPSSCQTSRKTFNLGKSNRSHSKETASLQASYKYPPEDANKDDKTAVSEFKLRASQISLAPSNLDCLSDTSSLTSVDFVHRSHRKSSLTTNNLKSFGNENASECVICMSEGRDTMLLPCRHMCLCSTCAQSLRYQANSCPICRCPFKAALNLSIIRRPSNSPSTDVKSTVSATTASMVVNGGGGSTKDEGASSNVSRKTAMSEQLPEVCCRP